MSAEVGSATGWCQSPWEGARQTEPWKLLLVGANRRWSDIVTVVAGRFGAVVTQVANSRAALSRLMTGDESFSLVMLQPRRDDRMAGDLADLATAEGHAQAGLVVLGRGRAPSPWGSAPAPARGIVVEQVSQASVSAIIGQHIANAPPATPVFSTGELKAALDGEKLALRYQPIVRLADRKPIGLETLARLDDPAHGLLPPDSFIPQMEAAGLSHALTRTMIAQAMREVCRHGLAKLGFCIGLNMPLNVLLMPEMVDWIDQCRRQCNVVEDHIVVELTETQPVEDHAALGTAIARLQALDFRVALDDVSPVMRNLDRLLQLGFKTIKFDRAVTVSALTDPAARSFITDIVAMARATGRTTVAEGIEDAETLALMTELGVTSGQGYFIARPIPAGAVKVWLETARG